MHALLGTIAAPLLVLAAAVPLAAAEKSEDRPPAAEPAIAEGWQVCNESSRSAVYVAYAVTEGESWMTYGWRQIGQGACSLILDTLDNRYVYYFANSADGTTWAGDKQLCVHPKDKFETAASVNCAPGYELRGFITVDTGDYKAFTSRLTD